MKFRKKPVVIEAALITSEGILDQPDWLKIALANGDVQVGRSSDDCVVHLRTLEGVMTAHSGDWIIRGVQGEIYSCRGDIFEATYESAE